jgi:hypothetical protein
VRQWVEGTRAVCGGEDLHRLRVAYQAARLLAERDSNEVVQAWFQGLNPALGDRSRARLLRGAQSTRSGRRSSLPLASSPPSAEAVPPRRR